jgi:leucyl-tRNA synthetase
VSGRRGYTQPTPEELLVWKEFPQSVWNYRLKTGIVLSDGKPHWLKLDIAFTDLKLCVEIDGGIHRMPKKAANDIRRTKILEGLGWKVLRFWNREVISDLTKVRADIQSTISQLKAIQAIR